MCFLLEHIILRDVISQLNFMSIASSYSLLKNCIYSSWVKCYFCFKNPQYYIPFAKDTYHVHLLKKQEFIIFWVDHSNI